LVGVDLGSTVSCLKAGALTLAWAARRCLGQRYYTYWRQAMWSAYHLSACWKSRHRFERARLMQSIESSLLKAKT